MKILITYNEPPPQSSAFYTCHGEVLEQVEDVQSALKELGHETNVLSIGRNIKEELRFILDHPCDLVFNLCESILENSRLQPSFTGFLEITGIPFTGSNTETILTAINKYKAKILLLQQGIPAPKGWLLRESEAPDKILQEIPISSYPVIVKPNMEDGSIGLRQGSVAKTPDKLVLSLDRYKKECTGDALIEQYIAGREFNVGFLGKDDIKPLPPAEIRFKSSFPGRYKFLSYDAKWEKDSPEYAHYERISPPNLPESTLTRIIQLGKAAYKAVGLSGYGRIDFRMDNQGNLYVIDVNANPDLSKSAGLARSARNAGVSYTSLIQAIIDCPFYIKRNTIF